jgi:lysyl endopeptidase
MRLFFISLILISSGLYAQQGDGGKPKSRDFSEIDQRIFSTPNLTALRQEDEINDAERSGPWRFGFNNYTNLTMENAGVWHTLENGDKIWQLHLTCVAAQTVNLTFEDVLLPEGNELYVYNPAKDFILGKFTEYHLYEGQLGTELIPGNTAIVEYYVPAHNISKLAQAKISTVTHGYRTANEYIEKAFGSSGSCNMNVNCPDGAAWTNERNSAVMLVSGSNGFCSGALINTVLSDGKPYVLTANHCGANPTNWIFRFNWQSNGCTAALNPSFSSLSGAVLRARRSPSDFSLVEITGGLVNNTIPASYNPYFAGWDNSGAIPTATVCIHHPDGDIKKISFDDNPAVISQGMGSSEPNSTWTVQWDRNTTTEGGSSGSPLFDQNHRIIGQLWGGGASCGNLNAPDYYGRLSSSWEPVGSTSVNQLKYWLDPNATGTQIVNGYDPFGPPPPALDATLGNPLGVSGTFCSNTVTPSITLTNLGTSTLTSANINYGFNGQTNLTYNWTGSLNQWQSTVVSLPSLVVNGGTNTFTAVVSNTNGAADENATNNSVSSTFVTVVNGQSVDLNLTLDCWGSETTWELRNAANVVLYSGNGYANTPNPTPIAQTFCLSYGCYSFRINDSYGDGLAGTSCVNGFGSYQLLNGQFVLAELTQAQADFGTSNTQTFCLNLGIDDLELSGLVSIYPNPTREYFSLVSTGVQLERMEIRTITGQMIANYSASEIQNKIYLEGFSNGVYWVVVHTDKGAVTKQLIVQ